MREKIAVVGSGISGISCAYWLQKKFDVTLFEKSAKLGGHTNTVTHEHHGESYNIDTGFIVFNNKTYPNFEKLLSRWGVDSQDSDMSFSVYAPKKNLVYNGTNLSGLFCQKKNMRSPNFLRMLYDITRFNKHSIAYVNKNPQTLLTLGEYISKQKYGALFKDYYLFPMAAAIWSTPLNDIAKFPLQQFVMFFKNHGLLSINNRPQWKVIKNGSSSYLKKFIQHFSGKVVYEQVVNISPPTVNNNIITNILQKKTQATKTTVTTTNNNFEFDKVIIATHSDEAAMLLTDQLYKKQRALLEQIPYKKSEVVMHYDKSILPPNKKAWASWNYLIDGNAMPTVTYNMNILQDFSPADNTVFCVTLNQSKQINPDKIIAVNYLAHPQYTQQSRQAAVALQLTNGENNIFFAGAYFGNGFHEDGVNSALAVNKLLTCKTTSDNHAS